MERIENKTLGLQADLNQQITRRQFLGSGLKLTAVTLLGIGFASEIVSYKLNQMLPENRFPEASKNVEYSQSVEQVFQIELKNDPPAKWTENQVLMLGQFLSLSPDNFYKPINKRKFPIVISNSSESCGCNGLYVRDRLGNDYISLQENTFNQDNIEGAHDEFFHEFTHKADADSSYASWNKVEEVLRDKFNLAAPKIFDNLLNEKPAKDDLYLNLFRQKLMYGFYQKTPNELVASLGEIYSYGKDAFSLISFWLGGKTTESFYGILKDNIFKGLEYKTVNDSKGNLAFDKETKIPLEVDSLNFLARK